MRHGTAIQPVAASSRTGSTAAGSRGGARAQLLQSFACKPFFQFTGEPTVGQAVRRLPIECAGRTSTSSYKEGVYD
eukprot:COSAG01_NODE_190_length_22595_cov_16.442301_19_plen_76_part_00